MLKCLKSLLCSLFFISFSLFADADPLAKDSSLQRIKDRGFLIVGVAYDLPGMGYRNPKTGQVEGFEADLGRVIAKKLFSTDNRIRFISVLPDKRIAALQRGLADLVIAELTITPERSKEIDFSIPYYVAREAILVRKDSPIKSFEDLKGKKIAVAAGTVTYKNFTEELKQSTIVTTPTEAGGFAALKSRRVDAVGNDNINLTLLRAADKDADDFVLIDIGQHFKEKPFGIGIKKDRQAVLQFVNDTLKEMKQSGDIDKLLQKYLPKDESPSTP